MDGELEHLGDRELERLAYGRAVTRAEQARAAAAGEELARRARPPSPDAPLDPRADPMRAIEADRPWWRRPIAVAGAGILVGLIAAGSVVASVVTAQNAPPAAFALFDREPTAEERELRPVMQAGGHLAPLGPRILDEIEYGTVVAWLPRPAGTLRQTEYDGINTREGPPQVCLGVIEPDPVARTLVSSDVDCTEVADFAEGGVSLTLRGQGGEYGVTWSPEGAVDLEVAISEAQRDAMEPGFRRAFLPGALGPVPYPQDTAALLYDEAGYVDASIRLVTSMSDVDPNAASDELLIAFLGRGVGAIGDETACLAVVDDQRMRELACTDENSLSAGSALALDVTRGIRVFIVTWTSDGDISLRGTTSR